MAVAARARSGVECAKDAVFVGEGAGVAELSRELSSAFASADAVGCECQLTVFAVQRTIESVGVGFYDWFSVLVVVDSVLGPACGRDVGGKEKNEDPQHVCPAIPQFF